MRQMKLAHRGWWYAARIQYQSDHSPGEGIRDAGITGGGLGVHVAGQRQIMCQKLRHR